MAEPVLDFYSAAGSADLPGATSDPRSGFGNLLSSALSATMVIGALLVFGYLIWGAIEWITASGDSGKIQKARDKMTQAIIGLIVLASTLAIFSVVQSFLGIRIINFGGGATL